MELGIVEHRTLEKVVAALQRLPGAVSLWREFGHFVRGLSPRLQIVPWAASMEVCTDLFAASGVVRCHLHWYRKCGQKMFIKRAKPVLFRRSAPAAPSRSLAGSSGIPPGGPECIILSVRNWVS